MTPLDKERAAKEVCPAVATETAAGYSDPGPAGKLETRINKVFQDLGAYLEADRIYIFCLTAPR